MISCSVNRPRLNTILDRQEDKYEASGVLPLSLVLQVYLCHVNGDDDGISASLKTHFIIQTIQAYVAASVSAEWAEDLLIGP